MNQILWLQAHSFYDDDDDDDDDDDNSYSDVVPAEGRPMRANLWNYIIHGKPFKEEKPSNPTSLRILFESRSRDLSEEQLTGDRLKEKKVAF